MAAMKYLNTTLMTGFLIPFMCLCAEQAQNDNEWFPHFNLAPQEEASLSSLEEELSLLDEEFEEFKEELFSLENDLQKKDDPSLLEKIQEALKTSEDMAIKEPSKTETPPVIASPAAPVEKPFVSEEKKEPASIEFSTVAIEPIDQQEAMQINEPSEADLPALRSVQRGMISRGPDVSNPVVSVNLSQAFAGSPIIYSILFVMSVIAFGVWLFAIFSLRHSVYSSDTLLKNIQNKLHSNQFDEALSLCSEENTLFCKMIMSGIQSRRHGLPVMIEAMKAEGKRASTSFWQKLSLLNDIAIIAPMIGLLGTVLGMFYAFYNINRSIESISTLFDGLGVSVGTTVAGLIVAILALILHSTAKYRLVRTLAQVENEAHSVATLIDDRTSIYKG
jgi:biopolymer transport protein ExbB